MLSRVPGIIRILKLGALGGVIIGVVKAVKRRRNRAIASESTWPTLAETAKQDGIRIDDDADDNHKADSSSDMSDSRTTDSAENEDSAAEADDTADTAATDDTADTTADD